MTNQERIDPNRAICNRCKYEMERGELFGRDLKKLACPNCYSSNLSVIEVRFELGYAVVGKDRHEY